MQIQDSRGNTLLDSKTDAILDARPTPLPVQVLVAAVPTPARFMAPGMKRRSR
ncbi:hypothetical protein KFZ76_20175 [Methylovulum psychrotolerans]|jgi:hypothetical protein|uniref:hypothetical protein n=1 Tax=Methylovulum psychrotolerans TaxID=1704499 RepID=UPI001BFFA0F6|nr:hypothetical protein [Methylovulum psychrotolerans]MBT9100022.1 hypothetical protein [Methylovulum psychrotolerans]